MAQSRENTPTPIRRGPIVTLARLWTAVPVPTETTDFWLPEPHQTFIGTFVQIITRDKWFIGDYDKERWDQECKQNLGMPKDLESLSVLEIRDFLTYCYRGDRYCTGYLNQMARNGDIQKVLLRLADLVWLDDRE